MCSLPAASHPLDRTRNAAPILHQDATASPHLFDGEVEDIGVRVHLSRKKGRRTVPPPEGSRHPARTLSKRVSEQDELGIANGRSCIAASVKNRGPALQRRYYHLLFGNAIEH
jgi:hypothetical protein